MTLRPHTTTGTVDEFFTVVGGGTPATANVEFWDGTIPWVTSADVDEHGTLHPRRRIAEVAVQHSATNVVPAGSIVVATRVGLGKAGLTAVPTAFSQDCHGLVPKSGTLDPQFGMYQLQALVLGFRHVSRGTTIAGVTKKQLTSLPFWLPPPEVQQGRTDAIERRLSLLRSASESLDHALRRVRRYREVTLERAARGKLLSQGDGSLQQQRPIRELATMVVDGDHNPPKRVPEGIPHLTARNIQGSQVRVEGCTYISPADFRRVRARYSPEAGDVIITCVGTIGRTAVVPPELEFSADRNLAAVRVDPAVLEPHYLKIVLDAPSWQELMAAASGSTAQPHLYLRDIRALTVPVPSLEEQRQIITEVDRRLSVIDALVGEIERALARRPALRSAILRSILPDIATLTT